MPSQDYATLLVSCVDRTGIVAEIAGFMHAHGCNITRVDQSVDAEHGAFRMRMVIEPNESRVDHDAFEAQLEQLSKEHRFAWKLHWSDERLRMAILCTREPHCLHDLLQRHESGEIDCDIPVIISNHETLRPIAEFFEIPYVHLPVDSDRKTECEDQLRHLLAEHDVDVVVLARYMQILSNELVSEWPNQIINIHHSFLPAFVGAAPYRQAHERGVKLIGATAHYVTADLDEGPIISQDVIQCSHRDSVQDLVRKGRDVERTTLSRAVRWHLERRLLLEDDRVVVFV